MSQPAKSSEDPPRTGHQAENIRQTSVDLLNTVRLPPPSVSHAYAWSGSNRSGGRQPLAENTNMLRTPESIMRFNDVGAQKRAAEIPGDETLKQRKIHGQLANHMRRDRRSLAPPMSIPGSGITPGSGPYDRQYYEQGRLLERHGNDLSGSIPQVYASRSPVYAPRGHIMLSPSASPYDRKTESPGIDLMRTPTRGERPASTPDLTYDQRMFLLQRRMPSSMPPIPPPPASLTSSAVPPMPMGTLQQKSRPYTYQGERYAPSYTGSSSAVSHIKHIEIPPPDLMPKIEDDGKKPTYSYAMLIGMAILRAPERKLTLSQIYAWIMDTFEFYRNSKPTWHNSIRHNLSLNKAFEKQVRPKGDSGKGNYWTIVKGLEYQFMKPRPSKRGSDGLMQAQAQLPLEHHRSPNFQPTPSKADFNHSQASLDVESIAFPKTPDAPVHEGRNSTHTNDSIPSDGTEPDERILEEESRESHVRQLSVEPKPKIEEPPRMDHRRSSSVKCGGGLPQLHTMSSSSTSRPHSPSIMPANSDLQLLNSASKRPTSSIATSSQLDTHTAYSPQHNEWHGQGQFAFRCSTPSLLSSEAHESPYDHSSRLTFEASTALSAPSPLPFQSGEVSPKRELHLSNEGTRSLRPLAVVKPSECERKAGLDVSSCPPIHVTSMGQNDLHADDTGSTHHVPKTPEKMPRASSDSSLSSSSKAKRLMPILNPAKSFESPYAGTLEFSPGLAHGGEHDSGISGDSTAKPFYRRHHRKKSSLHNLSDYLELDLRKADRTSGHHRSNSDSSDDNNSSTAAGHLTSNGLGGNSHLGSLALSFDIELSPRVVVTPIRRPFDTPIRDQAQAYSPYCCRSTSNFGSPLRRS